MTITQSHLISSSNRNEPTRFLSSQNPALVKRNVLASFTDILLMPVTIVPRAVGSVGTLVMEGGRGAVQGIGMLNPARWVGGGAGAGAAGGYSKNLDGTMIFDGEEEQEKLDVPSRTLTASSSVSPSSSTTNLSTTPTSLNASSTAIASPSHHKNKNKLELLLSLDVALELIHADRDSMKRVETFSGYPGHYGFRVRDTIEELFILLLKALGERHVEKGFGQ
jgi:recyclin-1